MIITILLSHFPVPTFILISLIFLYISCSPTFHFSLLYTLLPSSIHPSIHPSSLMGSYKFTSRIHVSIFLATLTIQCVFAAKNCNFPAIFNFGDSNSDTGGLAASFGPIPSPSGETFFHSPQGRDCDGRLVIDFIGMFFYNISVFNPNYI